MATFFSQLKVLFEGLGGPSALGAACGACQKGMVASRADSNLGGIFYLNPLSDGEPEAVRATQRGVRLMHEGRVEEAIR